MLKPQDIIVSLKLLNGDWEKSSFAHLASELGMSVSETHQAFYRAREAGLISPLARAANHTAMAELLIHGLKYLLPVHPGKRTRGLVTGFGAAPLLQHFKTAPDDADIMVWPDPHGTIAGWEIEPIIKSAPIAARNDPKLYEWLVLADAVRGAGRARERKLAEEIIRKRLDYNGRH